MGELYLAIGKPDKELAEEMGAGLVVLGSVLGSVVHRAHYPVLMVQSKNRG